MANAHIVFGKVKRDGIVDSSFTSETVASGATSAASTSAASIASISAVGGNIYVAFGTGTPSAAANPRAFIPQNGTLDFSIPSGTKVAVLDA